VTVASEPFGTEIRSTVTNTVSNFVRGAVIRILCMALALIGLTLLPESFGNDLDYRKDP